MQIEIGPHLEEAELEQYSMGRLPVDRLPPFEEHFLACESCQDQLLETEAYVNAVRSVSPTLRKVGRSNWEQFFVWPRPAWLAGAAIAVTALLITRVWSPGPIHAPEIAIVLLQASRGIEGLSLAKAAAGQPVALTIDLREIPGASQYRFEIVDSRGRAELDSVVIPENGKIVQTLTKGLSAGRHYVRLYGPDGDLLREFSLRVGEPDRH
jgi:hypothetical protein